MPGEGFDEDRPWLGEEPSGRPDTSFPPFATGVAVFTAIFVVSVVIAVTRPSGPDGRIAVLGLVLGLAVGIGFGLVLARERDR